MSQRVMALNRARLLRSQMMARGGGPPVQPSNRGRPVRLTIRSASAMSRGAPRGRPVSRGRGAPRGRPQSAPRGATRAIPSPPGTSQQKAGPQITLDNYFGRIFILNMERRLDRWFNMVHRMEKQGVTNYERFLATDGYSEPYRSQWEAYSKTPFNRYDQKYGRKAIRSPGVWGILNSMKRMILLAKKRGLKRFLVLQDDAMFHHDFARLFDEKIRKIPKDWKMLYLGVTQYDYARGMLEAKDFYNPMGMADGAFAVAFDSSIYDFLIKQINRFVMPFDSGPLMAVQRQYARQTFVIRPFLIIADTSESDCRSDRRTEEFARKVKWDYPRFVEHTTIPEQPLVSVIIATHNDAHYIADAIYSILYQSYRNIEIVVIDNASTDQTEAEVAQFTSERIRFISSPRPIDLPALWNVGLLMARGDLISFHSPRAKSLQVRYEAQVNAIRKGAHVVSSPHRGYLIRRAVIAEVGYLDLSPLIDPFYEYYAKLEAAKFPATHIPTTLYIPYADLVSGSQSETGEKGRQQIDQFHRSLISSGKSLYRPFPPKDVKVFSVDSRGSERGTAGGAGYQDLDAINAIIEKYQ